MLQFPIGIGRIEKYGFANCTSLENIEIPNSVEGYGMGIFENCSDLKTIEIANHPFLGFIFVRLLMIK